MKTLLLQCTTSPLVTSFEVVRIDQLDQRVTGHIRHHLCQKLLMLGALLAVDCS